ncbi:MAG: AAA family ATPase [Deltaproteobacteria bacterium]|jgi:putative DNA primase/helicase|nr:AAA family ATPase [Deltaproteobacteria bacterium]
MDDIKNYNTKEKIQYLSDMIEYEYIERISVANYVSYIRKMLPLDDETPNRLEFMRHDYNISRDLSWTKNSNRESGRNLIDLYTSIKAIKEEYSYRSFADFFGISMKKSDIMVYNDIPEYHQQNILTIVDEYIHLSINSYKIEYSIHKYFVYRNLDGSIRGIVVSYKDNSDYLLNIVFVQYIRKITVEYADNSKLAILLQRPIDYSQPNKYIKIERSFFTEPYPIYNILGLYSFPEKNVIIVDNEEKCDDLNNCFLKNNNINPYLTVSWPGGEYNTVGKVDWSGLRDRNIIFPVYNTSESCRLAYETYRSVNAYRPSSFKFWLFFDEALDRTSSNEILYRYPIIDRKQFVNFAKKYFNLTLEDTKEQEIELICYSAKTFLETEFQETPDIIPGILPQPGIMEVFSDRGVGKSWFCLELAKAFSEGSCPFQKSDWMVSPPKNVLYIEGELINSKMQERMRLLNIKDNNINNNGKFIVCLNIAQNKNIDLLDKNFQKYIYDKILKERIDIIFIDNLASLASSSLGNDPLSWVPINNWFQELKKLGTSIIFVHHAGKKGDQRGSNAKEDNADAVIALEAVKGSKGTNFVVKFTKARYAAAEQRQHFELRLNFSEDGSSAVWEESVPKEPVKSVKKAGSGKKTKTKNLDQATKEEIREKALKLFEDGLKVDDVASKLDLENRQELYRDYFENPELISKIKEARKKSRVKLKAEAKTKLEAGTGALKDEDQNSLSEIPAQAQDEAEPGSGDDAAENKTTDE